MIYLVIFIPLCVMTGLMFVWIARKTALKLAIVDKPDNLIKVHAKVTPYLGGAGFYINALVIYLVFTLVSKEPVNQKEYWILGLSVGMLLLGIIDDAKRIKPLTKFAFQSLFAVVLMTAGVRLEIMYFPDALNYFLTFLWIVGMSNAFNLIDIMDGLCGGVAMIAGFFLFFSGSSEYHFLLFVSLSILAFLMYNFPPASIFMGDAGSLTIGFVFSAYAILGSYTVNNRLGLLAPLLILWLPIYETILVTILRLKKKKNPFMGSKDHFAFRLKAAGFPIMAILFVAYFLTIIMGQTAFLAVYMTGESAMLVYSIVFLFFVALFFVLSRIKID